MGTRALSSTYSSYLSLWQASGSPPTSFQHGVSYRSFEVNTFSLKFHATKTNVLVDPCERLASTLPSTKMLANIRAPESSCMQGLWATSPS